MYIAAGSAKPFSWMLQKLKSDPREVYGGHSAGDSLYELPKNAEGDQIMQSRDWIWEPTVGWGPVKFGMTPKQLTFVDQLFGAVQSIQEFEVDYYSEYRSYESPVFGYRDGRLSAIDIGHPAPGFSAFGLNPLICEPSDFLTLAAAADPATFDVAGSLLFANLSLAVSGLYNIEEERPVTAADLAQYDGRGVCAAAAGAYDALRNDWRPLQLRL